MAQRVQDVQNGLSFVAGDLAQGISRVPPHRRLPGQVENASNVDFPIAEGIVKRAGTIYGWKVTGFAAASNVRLHGIKRDDGEKYIVAYGFTSGANLIVAYSTAGTAATVTPSAAATTYLNLNSASADQMRFRNIGDATFIVNMTVASGTTASASYTVTSEWSDYDEMRSYTPAASTYHHTREDFPSFPAGYYFYYPGTATFCKWQSGLMTGMNLASAGGQWDNSASSPFTFRIRFRKRVVQITGGVWDNTAKTLTKTAEWTDYSHNVDDILWIESGTGFSSGWVSVAEKMSANALRLTQIGGAAIAIANTSDVSTVNAGSNNGIGVVYDVVYTTNGDTLEDMHAVARRWQTALVAGGCEDGLVAWVEAGYQSGYFEITGPFRGSGRRVLDIEGTGAGTDVSVTGQAFDYSAGTSTTGTGSDSPTLAVDDRWTQVPAPSQPDATPDATKMPVRMDRTVIGPPATFTITQPTWTTRVNGDEDSNPSPRLILTGAKIRDIGFHRERMYMAGSRYVMFSDIEDQYNFYLKDPAVVVDSDPIDIALSSDNIAVIDHVVPWRDTLSVFAFSARQFVFNAPEALTPSTGSFTASTAFNTLGARPEILGQNLYFVGSGGTGGNAQLLEEFYDFASAATDAGDVSAHVPGFLPDAVRTIATHANSRRVFVLKTDDAAIYVYRSHLKGSEKIQSAWSKWSFPAYTISDMVVIDDDLWILVQSALAFHIERIPLSPENESTGMPFVIHGDRRMTLTGSYSAPTTTWTLPSSASDTTINTIVLGNGSGAAGTILTPTTAGGTTVTKTGDYSAAPAVLCRSFATSVELSIPYLRDDGGRPVMESVILQRALMVEHRESGAYSVRVDRPGAADHTESFTATAMTVNTGRFKAWASGNVRDNTFYVESTDVRPLAVTAIDHIGDEGDGGGPF